MEEEDLEFINTIKKENMNNSGFIDEKVALKWKSQILDTSRSFLLSLFDPSLPTENVEVEFPSSFFSFHELVEEYSKRNIPTENSSNSSSISKVKISKSAMQFIKSSYEIVSLGKKILLEKEILSSNQSSKESKIPVINYSYWYAVTLINNNIL